METDHPQPLDPVGDGRGPDGRFRPGNRAGKGNPLAKKAQKLRTALFRAVTPTDLREIVKRLVGVAKGGDVQAAKLILERLLGPPVPADFQDRLDRLEELLIPKP